MAKENSAYRRVYNEIRRAIDDGEYPTGSFMPSEKQLEEKYDVSRITIRKAMELLSADGYVTIKQGRGTTVNDTHPVQNLSILTSITSSAENSGKKAGIGFLYMDKMIPGDVILDKLKLSAGTAVVRLQRLQLLDDAPISLTTNYIIPELETNLIAYNKNSGSFYRYLGEVCNCELDSAEDIITARTADITQANMLQIPVGSPLLYVRRVTFSRNKPITYDIVYLNAQKYSFHVHSDGYR